MLDQGRAIQLLERASGKPRISHSGHWEQVYFPVLTPDGRTAITVGYDDALSLWDAATGRLRRRLNGHGTDQFGLQLAPMDERCSPEDGTGRSVSGIPPVAKSNGGSSWTAIFNRHGMIFVALAPRRHVSRAEFD